MTKTKEQEGEVIFIRGVPEEIKRSFKTACSATGKTMTEVIIELMRKFSKHERKET